MEQPAATVIVAVSRVDVIFVPIEQNIIIYDDTVGFFNWGDYEIYGVEVTNRLMASSQRQFFELLWRS